MSELRAWHNVGATARTAVNVSRVQFAHSDVASCVKRALSDTRIAPDSLIVEVTESAFEENTDHLIDQLEQLHALGTNLALDDFGTGYSSLKYLQQCPFDVIKLDMPFTQYVTEEDYAMRSCAWCRSSREH